LPGPGRQLILRAGVNVIGILNGSAAPVDVRSVHLGLWWAARADLP